MTATSRRIGRGYDRLAPHYERLAFLCSAGAIQRSQAQLLESVRSRRRGLIIGGGTGVSLEAMFRAGFPGYVIYADISGRMLQLARERIRREFPDRTGDVGWVQCEPDALRVEPVFDWIGTHYFLDQFTPPQLDRVVRALAGCLIPGGVWHDADFAPLSAGLARRGVQRLVLPTLYAAFGVACGLEARRLPPIEEALGKVGLEPVARRFSCAGLLRTVEYAKAPGFSRALQDRPRRFAS